jgi:SAM-dependent methyltransferase
MANSFEISRCLCCESENLNVTLDLGLQPLANDFRPPDAPDCEEYPLVLMTCADCWHSQLSYCVSRQQIFKNYAYASGTSNTLRSYFSWFGKCLKAWLAPNKRVLEIAANDGTLVSELIKLGVDASGIDPATNLVNAARGIGLPVIEGYWPNDADRLEGHFDTIICMNVLAHVDNPKAFLAQCSKSLAPGGVIIVQPSQVRMFQNFEFDTCYHEHLSFFNSRSLSALAESVDLELKAATIVKVHGDSPMYFLTKRRDQFVKDPSLFFKQGEFGTREDLIEYEQSINLFDRETYVRFSNKCSEILRRFGTQVSLHRDAGFKVVFVGAAAKAMTVINASKLKPDLFLDEATLKIGKFAPGVKVRIDNLASLGALSSPAFIVITAWNFKSELLRKISEAGVPSGSRYYCYFPKEECGTIQ